jgi:hypothetical protein
MTKVLKKLFESNGDNHSAEITKLHNDLKKEISKPEFSQINLSFLGRNIDINDSQLTILKEIDKIRRKVDKLITSEFKTVASISM